MAGAIFESYVISEVVKSFCNRGIEPPLYFYRDKDKVEIDLMILQDDVLYPVEIKKTATPVAGDARNFFVTDRIKGIRIGGHTVVCCCAGPAAIKPGVMAIPVGYV